MARTRKNNIAAAATSNSKIVGLYDKTIKSFTTKTIKETIVDQAGKTKIKIHF